MNIKKILGIAVGVALVGWILYGNLQNQKKSDVLTIGVNLPLSGSMGIIGKPYAQGLTLGIKDELLANGLSDDKVNLKINDNQGSAMEAATILKRHNLESYDTYIAGTTDAVNALMNEVDKNKAFFTLALDEGIPQQSPNNIRILINSGLTKKKLYDFITTKVPKKVAIIMGCPSCQVFANTVAIPFLKEQGIDYHLETFEAGFKEYRTMALKIKEYNPDIILAKAFSSELLKTITALQENDLIKDNNTWTSIDFIDFFKLGVDMSTMHNIVFDATEYNINVNSTFEKEYYESYKELPNIYAVYAYDTGRLIVKSWLKNHKITPETIIAETPYNGVAGLLVMDSKTRDLISTQILGTLDKNNQITEFKNKQE